MISVLNSLSLCVRTLAIMFFFGVVQAEEFSLFTPEELLTMRANAYCSNFEQHYQECFEMTSAECSTLYKNAFAVCDQLASEDYFDSSSQSSIDQFGVCYTQELSNYIVSKGVDLDAECE